MYYQYFEIFTDHPILQILETRLNDRVAQDFVRRQRARMASQIAYAKHTL